MSPNNLWTILAVLIVVAFVVLVIVLATTNTGNNESGDEELPDVGVCIPALPETVTHILGRGTPPEREPKPEATPECSTLGSRTDLSHVPTVLNPTQTPAQANPAPENQYYWPTVPFGVFTCNPKVEEGTCVPGTKDAPGNCAAVKPGTKPWIILDHTGTFKRENYLKIAVTNNSQETMYFGVNGHVRNPDGTVTGLTPTPLLGIPPNDAAFAHWYHFYVPQNYIGARGFVAPATQIAPKPYAVPYQFVGGSTLPDGTVVPPGYDYGGDVQSSASFFEFTAEAFKAGAELPNAPHIFYNGSMIDFIGVPFSLVSNGVDGTNTSQPAKPSSVIPHGFNWQKLNANNGQWCAKTDKTDNGAAPPDMYDPANKICRSPGKFCDGVLGANGGPGRPADPTSIPDDQRWCVNYFDESINLVSNATWSIDGTSQTKVYSATSALVPNNVSLLPGGGKSIDYYNSLSDPALGAANAYNIFRCGYTGTPPAGGTSNVLFSGNILSQNGDRGGAPYVNNGSSFPSNKRTGNWLCSAINRGILLEPNATFERFYANTEGACRSSFWGRFIRDQGITRVYTNPFSDGEDGSRVNQALSQSVSVGNKRADTLYVRIDPWGRMN